ncbi:hypothetical protein NL676_039746 [Syzygium grande]|nr:hypothetical protein NL676_039746 [Syzygium grande]
MMDPRDLPEPVSGINFCRFWMPEQEWVALVAAHCDSWLLTVAYDVGGRSGFTKSEREMLFQKMNELPTVCETVQESGKCNDQSSTMMSKKPESCLAVYVPSPHEDESGAAIEDGHNDGSSS